MGNGTVIAFTSLAPQKVALYLALQEQLRERGLRLFIVVFDEFRADLSKLGRGNCLSIRSSDLSRSDIPWAPSLDIWDAGGEEQLFRLQEEVYGAHSGPAVRTAARRLAWIVDRLVTWVQPKLVLRCFLARPPHAIVRRVLEIRGVDYLEYQSWAYPRTFQVGRKLWFPGTDGAPDASGLDMGRAKDVVRALAGAAEQKRPPTEETPYTHGRDYVLYLTGGYFSGAALESAVEHDRIGMGWGSHARRANAIERALEARWPECDLLVREHPSMVEPLTGEEFVRPSTRLVNTHSLDDLMLHARGVVCGQTTLVYHALNMSKRVCVLGRHELDCLSSVTLCLSEDDLEEWLSGVSEGSVSEPDKEAFEECAASYLRGTVLALDYPETFHVFDRWASSSSVIAGLISRLAWTLLRWWFGLARRVKGLSALGASS